MEAGIVDASIILLLARIWVVISFVTLALGIAAMFDIWRRNLAGKGRAYFAIIVGALPMLFLVIAAGISNSGSTGFTATEQREIDLFLAEYGIIDQFLAEYEFNDTVMRNNLTKSVDVEGNTLLHHAASNEQLVVVRYLISKGADVNVRNRDGWTPLHWVAHLNEGIDVARYLIARGANLNATTNSGYTPLEWARHMENTAVIRYLESMSGRLPHNAGETGWGKSF